MSVIQTTSLTDPTSSSVNSIPQAVVLDDGFVLAVWVEYSESVLLKAQVFGKDGRAAGEPYVISSDSKLAEPVPSLAKLSNGEIVIGWNNGDNQPTTIGSSDTEYLIQQIAISNGEIVESTAQQIVFDPVFNTGAGHILSTADGGFIVTLGIHAQSADGVTGPGADGGDNSWEVLGQRYDSSGSPTGSLFSINTDQYQMQRNPDLVSLNDGGYAATYRSGTWGDSDIYLQFFDQYDQKIGDAINVSSATGMQEMPTATLLANGNLLIGWANQEGVGSFVQEVTLTGQLIGSPIQVNAVDSIGSRQVNGDVWFPVNGFEIAGLATGGFVASWTEMQSLDGNDVWSSYYQRFGSDHVAIEAPVLLNTLTGSSAVKDAGSKGQDVAIVVDGDEVIILSELDSVSSGGSSIGMTVVSKPIFSITETTGYTNLQIFTASEYAALDVIDLRGWDSIETHFGSLSSPFDSAGIALSWDGDDIIEFVGFDGYIVGNGSDFFGSNRDEIVFFDSSSDISTKLDFGFESTEDVLSLRSTNVGISLDLSAQSPSSWLQVEGASLEVRGLDYVLGSEASDVFNGWSDRSNFIVGYSGSDSISGGTENDFLRGSFGDDTIIGGSGNDVLWDLGYNVSGYLEGGLGRDVYVVRGKKDSIDLDSDGDQELIVATALDDAAKLIGFELSDVSLGYTGFDSQSFADRLVISVSKDTLSAIANVDSSFDWENAIADASVSHDFSNLIEFDATDVSSNLGFDDGLAWQIIGSLNYTDNGSDSEVVVANTVVVLDEPLSSDALYFNILADPNIESDWDADLWNLGMASDDPLSMAAAISSGELVTDDYVRITFSLSSSEAVFVETFEKPTEQGLNVATLGALTDGSVNASIYLDLTAIADVYELDAEFGSWDYSDPDRGIVFIRDQYYEFKNIDGYVIDGLSDSATTEVIRVSTRSDSNETLVLGDGFGLEINLGDGPLSDADVLVVDGGALTFDLSSADENGYVSYTLTDANGVVGSGVIRGADIILGSEITDVGDQITGDAGNNIIVGFAGDDTLIGGAGDDFIIGGVGSDTIDGGDGRDIIIDLDADALTGGAGKDVFVVRGSPDLAASATITDLEVSKDGLSFDGLNSQAYEDRVAFNFSATALAATFSAILNRDIVQDTTPFEDPLTKKDYYQIAEGLDLNIRDGAQGDPAYVLEVVYDAQDGTGPTILGQVKFDVNDSQGALPEGQVYEAVLLEGENLITQVGEAVMAQIAHESGDSANLPPDDSVTLFVAVARQDKNAVFGESDGSKPVLVAYQPDGVEIATKFRPSNSDEVMLGSRQDDIYALNEQVFIDPNTGDVATNQSFGRDTIVEREGAADKLTLELSITDLLVGDLDLARVERGSEGDGRSLHIGYTDTSPEDGIQLNAVDTIIYKQFVDYNSSFRVEGLEMLDPGKADYNVFSLAEAVTETEMEAAGNVDSIFVGQAGVSEIFTIKAGITDGSGPIDVYMTDFDSTQDQIEFAGYDNVNVELSDDPAGYAAGFATVTANNAGTGQSVDFNVYFTDMAPDKDDWITATVTTTTG